MLERAIAHPSIEFLTNTKVEEVLGVDEKEVRGLRIKNALTNEESLLPVSGLFLGIGHIPNAKMFAGQIDLDEDGYVKTHDNVFTKVPGRVRLWGCAGPPLSPGNHCGWFRLHGCIGSGEISRRARSLIPAKAVY